MSLRRSFWDGYRKVRRRILGIPEPGSVNFGDLHRVTPIGRDFGEARGKALDRCYIEAFLGNHAEDIRGRVLEIGDDMYTRRFGGDRVASCDILHVSSDNHRATIVADLADAPHIPDASFDALVVTQTLQYIFDPASAVRTMHRILRPGGVLLLTVPCITSVPHGTVWAHTWYWSFTELVMTRLLSEAFAGGSVSTASYGNVLSATAMLYGLSAADITTEELDANDPNYPVIIGARAVRAES